jgi:type IV fimbrial biogenesis protein FimT
MTTLSSRPTPKWGENNALASPGSTLLWGHQHQRPAGFSLIELMVVITISAILIMVAAPSLTDMATSAKLNSDSSRWVASAQMARSEAIKRNRRVTMCASTDGETCATSGGANAWSSGWLIGHTVNSTWTVIQREAALSTGYRMEVASGTTPVYSLLFQPTGIDSTTATSMICRSSPAGNLQQHTIQLSAAGRMQLSKTPRTTACPTS